MIYTASKACWKYSFTAWMDKSWFLMFALKNLGPTIYFLVLIERLQEDPPAGVSGAPSENNIMVWNAVIFG